jgi:ABC-2 type transport system permease protein
VNKTLLIARRDYLQIIRSKAYIAALFLPLVIGGGSFLASTALNRGSARDQRIAVLDHTGVAATAVIQAAKDSNQRNLFNAETGVQVMPRFFFEDVKPGADEPAQLLDLSNRIRTGDLYLLLDLPAGALTGHEPVRYYTNSTGVDQTGAWLRAAVNDGLRRVRLAQLGVDQQRIPEVLTDVGLVSMNLPVVDPQSGKVVQGEKKNQVQTVAVPIFMVILLAMVVLLGSAPHLSAVAEDKMQRVFEMLLASASPFELMAGKVLAALCACLTTSAIYIVGGLMLLTGMAEFGFAPLSLLPWLLVYLVLDAAILSATGVALGSACNTAQDAQSLAFLLFLPITIPLLVLRPVMLQPNGALAVTMSFIPPFTPVLMLLRQSLPGGVPWWQPWLGLVGIIAWAAATIWAAARIFRIGILSQGKAPKLAELAQWVLRS